MGRRKGTALTDADGSSSSVVPPAPAVQPPAPADRSVGLWERVAGRLTRSVEEIEADELQQQAAHQGGQRMCDITDRDFVTVCGAVRSVTLPPRTNVPALVVDLYDGSQTVHLIWLGRRNIGGISPGTRLKASGRVSYRRGAPTIFNPAYEILPSHGR